MKKETRNCPHCGAKMRCMEEVYVWVCPNATHIFGVRIKPDLKKTSKNDIIKEPNFGHLRT